MVSMVGTIILLNSPPLVTKYLSIVYDQLSHILFSGTNITSKILVFSGILWTIAKGLNGYRR